MWCSVLVSCWCDVLLMFRAGGRILVFRAGVMCLTYGVLYYYTIIYYTYTYTYYIISYILYIIIHILLYIIHIILYLYLILYSSILFFCSSFLPPLSNPLFYPSSHPSSSFPILSFKVYVSGLTYTYLYSSSFPDNSHPACFIGWECRVVQF